MYIVTHPGTSHIDDRTATALVLATFGMMPVYRREPTKVELADSDVFVLDIGGEFDPVKKNFDHHQLPPDSPPDCALSLLVRSGILGEITSKALMSQSWFKSVPLIDSKGPDAYAEAHELSHFPYDLLSPLDVALGAAFEDIFDVTCAVKQEIVILLKTLGEYLIKESIHRALEIERIATSSREATIYTIGDVPIVGLVINMEVDRSTLGEYTRVHGQKSFYIYHDERGPHWRLLRGEHATEIMDFNRIANDSRIKFVHANGFTASTRERTDVTLDDCYQLIFESISQPFPKETKDE